MKTVTILRPWPHLIVHGLKRVENRTWDSGYRGPLAIHAGKGEFGQYDGPMPPGPQAAGAIVAIAELNIVFTSRAIEHPGFETTAPLRYRWLKGHLHATGPLCWVLDNVRRLVTPIPWRGAQGLWDLPDHLLQGAEMVAVEAAGG